jgi:hypothetical protein
MNADHTTNTTPKAPLCIFCDNQLGPGTKPEHILLSALGGRKTTTRADCSECNQRFGSTIDKAIADQVPMLRNMFQMPAGSGKEPPRVRNVTSTDGPINLEPDGTPDLRTKPFTVTPKGDGTYDLSFNVSNMEELARYVPHAAAQMGKTEDELWAQIEGKTAQKRTSYAPPIHFQLQLGGEEVLRSIAKSSLALLATVTGSEALRELAFADVRRFVMDGDTQFNLNRADIDARQIPSPAFEHLVETYGPMFNLLYVKSDGTGRTVAYFVIYNAFAWQIVLAESGGPASVEIALASNPLKPEDWSDEVVQSAALDFTWLNSPNGDGHLEATQRRLSAGMELYMERNRERAVGKVIEEVMSKHYTEGEMIRPGERGLAMVAEMASRITEAVMHIPTEQPFTITRPKKTGE